MKTLDIFIAHPTTTEQVHALESFMNALNIKYEVATDEDYNPDFVKKIVNSREQATNGVVTRIQKENLSAFLGI